MARKEISHKKRNVKEIADVSTSDSSDKQLIAESSSKRRKSSGKELQIWKDEEQKKKTTKKIKKKEKGKKKCLKEEKTGPSRSLVFRCSFAPLKNLMEKIKNKLTQEHTSIFSGTPFKHIFQMFYENKVQVTQINNQDIKKALFAILDCYSPDDVGFIISGNLIKFTVEDVSVLLGLKAYGVEIEKNSSHDRHKDSTLFKKYFAGNRNIYKDQISDRIEQLLEDENHVRDDVVLLIITYICITILFNNSANRLLWSHTPYFDDLKIMQNVNWAAAVHSFLVDKLNENYRRKMLPKEHKDYQEKNSVMGGCTIILLYWLCENTDIINKIEGSEDVFPRVGRWSLKEVMNMCNDPSTKWFIQVKVVPMEFEQTAEELDVIEPIRGEAEAHEEELELFEQIGEEAEAHEEIDYKSEYFRQVEENEFLKNVIKELQMKMMTGVMMKSVEEEQEVDDDDDENDDDDDIGEEQEKDGRAGDGDGAKEDPVEKESEMVNKLIENTSFLQPMDDDKISSMVKRIKEKKRGGERRKTEKQKVKKSTKGKNIMDLGNEEEIKDLSDWTRFKYFNLLSVEEQFVLEQYLKDILDGSTLAWASPDQHIIINASLVNDLMTGKYVDYQIIDWHAYKLLQDYETTRAVDPTLPKCVIFSACAWTMLKQSMKNIYGETDGSEDAYWSDVIEKLNGEEELFIFPMNTTKNSRDMNGYHWTLLVLQKTLLQEANGWGHYDSIAGTTTFKTRIAKECQIIANYVTPMINATMIKNKKFDYLFPTSPIKKMKKVPQQGYSVDCALFVIKFMGVVVSDEDSFVTSEYTNNAMDKMRAKIAHDLLTDKGLSFDKVTWEEQQDLVRQEAEEKKFMAEALKVTEEEDKKRLASKKANLGKQKKKK